jgi:hypothetical protein
VYVLLRRLASADVCVCTATLPFVEWFIRVIGLRACWDFTLRAALAKFRPALRCSSVTSVRMLPLRAPDDECRDQRLDQNKIWQRSLQKQNPNKL